MTAHPTGVGMDAGLASLEVPQLDAESRALLWADACLAAACFAVTPTLFGGIALRAHAGPVRSALADYTIDLAQNFGPVRKVPIHCADDRLAGGLDLAATLSRGRPVAQRGLLAETDGGVLILPMAERADGLMVNRLTAALDRGVVALERDGLAELSQARVGVLAFDEGLDSHETLAPAFAERLAFRCDLSQLSVRDCDHPPLGADAVEHARHTFDHRDNQPELYEALTALAAAFGVSSVRTVLHAVRAAQAMAALDGRVRAEDTDIEAAARLVIAPRATQLPTRDDGEHEEQRAEDEQEDADPQEQQPPDDPQNLDQDDDSAMPDGPLDDRILDAIHAAIPADLLQQLKLGAAIGSRAPMGASGQGGERAAQQRGRPLGARRGKLGGRQRLHLVETLRSAAPWQTLRRRERAHLSGQAAVHISNDDIRVRRFKQREESLTIFVVDASGSSALNRLAEVKGAVELLLAESYARRDHVALIAFRGQSADLVLPPTRSLVRAKRSLAALPGGGGTPLAAGIDAGLSLAVDARRRGQSPRLVLMTDGQANVGYDPTSGRSGARRDAMSAAERMAGEGVASLFIDTSPRRNPKAAELADAMRAVYLPLPHPSAAGIRAVVATAKATGG